MLEFKFIIPYNSGFSDNKKYVGYRSKILAQTYRAGLDEIIFKTWKLRGMLKKRKIYIEIIAFRPHMRGDIANFIKLICDGIKKGCGIDDNYYCGSWDYEIDKTNPRIDITIKQG